MSNDYDKILKENIAAVLLPQIALRKYIRQLSVLARLRNLVKETQRQVTDMGLLYDITKDYLYQEGRTKGREEGIVEGLTKGREEGREEGLTKGREQVKREAVAKMLAKQKLSIEEIADALEVTVAYVETIAKELRR